MEEKVIYIKSEKIGEKHYLESRPHEDLGFDWETHQDWIELGRSIYLEAGPVKIDSLVAALQELKAAGANYASCDWHCDHGELEVVGVRIELASDSEITEHRRQILDKELKIKEREIALLEEKLKKLKEA